MPSKYLDRNLHHLLSMGEGLAEAGFFIIPTFPREEGRG
jgi:hypothetical protein